jgi:hypothetical protein
MTLKTKTGPKTTPIQGELFKYVPEATLQDFANLGLPELEKRIVHAILESAPSTLIGRHETQAVVSLANTLGLIAGLQRELSIHGLVDELGEPSPIIAKIISLESLALKLANALRLTPATRHELLRIGTPADYPEEVIAANNNDDLFEGME